MVFLSHSYFDPQPIITGIVNKLIDFCVRPGLMIASQIIINGIINDNIDKLKPKVACTQL